MLRVLVVEDNPDIRSAVSDGLRDAGHDVVAVADGQLGLEQVLSTTFDVVVTDVRIPGSTGSRCSTRRATSRRPLPSSSA